MNKEFNLNNEISEAWVSACQADHELSNALFNIRNNLDKPISDEALHCLDEARSYIDQTIMDLHGIQKALMKEEE